MTTSKLPFEITPQTKRYLEDILHLEKEGLVSELNLEHKIVILIIRDFIPGEVSSPRQAVNRTHFWEYLEEQKYIKRFSLNREVAYDGGHRDLEMYDEVVEYLASKKLSATIVPFVKIDRELLLSKSVQVFGFRIEQLKELSEVKGSEDFSDDNTFLKLEDIKQVEKLLRDIKTEIPKEVEKSKKSLNEIDVIFDDNKAVIQIGDKVCQLPPYKNEHFFCRAMFEYLANEPVDWLDCYEKMTGFYESNFGKPKDSKENWRKVYDIVRILNNRIKEVANINDDLFVWQEKTIKRVK